MNLCLFFPNWFTHWVCEDATPGDGIAINADLLARFPKITTHTTLKCRFGSANSWRNEFTGEYQHWCWFSCRVLSRQSETNSRTFDKFWQSSIEIDSCLAPPTGPDPATVPATRIVDGNTNCYSSCYDKSHSRAALNSNDIYVSAFVSFPSVCCYFSHSHSCRCCALYWCSSLYFTNI